MSDTTDDLQGVADNPSGLNDSPPWSTDEADASAAMVKAAEDAMTHPASCGVSKDSQRSGSAT